MKSKLFLMAVVLAVLLTGCGRSSESSLGQKLPLSASARSICAQSSCNDVYLDEASISNAFPGSCTTFVASFGDTALFGNNEDYSNPNTYYWVAPSTEESHGGVYLGYVYGKPQGGINEKGLAFDGLALPATDLNPHPELPSAGRSFSRSWMTIMSKCATVEEAIAMARGFNWGRSISWQVLLADATGDAVIVGAGPDGELAFTRKLERDGYLVGTNFNRANPENRYGSYPCWRYDKAVAALEKIKSKTDLGVDYFRSILNAVHVEGVEQNTLYSNVFDLRNGVIYLYYWHQFDEVVTLNVAEQLTREPPLTRLSELFSQETVERASREHQRHVERIAAEQLRRQGNIIIGKMVIAWEYVGWVWLLLTAVSMVFLIWDLVRGQAKVSSPLPASWGVLLAWVLVVIIFGPFGLLVYSLSYRQPLRSSDAQTGMTNWRRALGATAWSVAASIVGLAIAFQLDHNNLPIERHLALYLSVYYVVLPFITTLLILLIVRTASPRNGEFRRMFVIRIVFQHPLLSGIISANMVGTSVFPTAIILVNRFFADGLVLTDPPFWSVLALAAIAGALIAFPIHIWMIRRGLVQWGVPSPDDKDDERSDSAPMKLPGLQTLGVVFLTVLFVVAAIVLTIAHVADVTVSATIKLLLESL